jgi:hypothetical protein
VTKSPSSGVHKTVVAACGTDHTVWGASFFKRDEIRTYLVTFEEACSPKYDLYQMLQLHFYVLLMMGAMDVRNM